MYKLLLAERRFIIFSKRWSRRWGSNWVWNLATYSWSRRWSFVIMNSLVMGTRTVQSSIHNYFRQLSPLCASVGLGSKLSPLSCRAPMREWKTSCMEAGRKENMIKLKMFSSHRARERDFLEMCLDESGTFKQGLSWNSWMALATLSRLCLIRSTRIQKSWVLRF